MIGPIIQLAFATAYAAGAVWLIKHEYVDKEKKNNRNNRK